MTWFRKKTDKVSESELIAYHLHELSPRRERAVARALEASATLAADSAAVEAALRAVKDAPRSVEQAAFTRVWAALQPGLRPYPPPIATMSRWRAPVLAGTALAGVAAVSSIVVASRHYQAARHHGAAAVTAEVRGPEKRTPHIPEHALAQGISGAPTVASPETGRHAPASWGRPHITHDARVYPPLAPFDQMLTIPLLRPAPLPSGPLATGELPLQGQPNAAAEASLPHDTPARDREGMSGQLAGMGAGNNSPHRREHLRPTSTVDVMLALGGTFIAPHSSQTAGAEQRTQTATHAIAALGALHQQFRSALGYRLTMSYTRPDFVYTYHRGGSDIDSRIFEAAGTYVIQGPHFGRISISADAGAALLAFLPTARVPAVNSVYRPAAVIGASADYAISKHWAARATCRAQIFRGPGFHNSSGIVPVTTGIVVSNEPAIGIVYRFGPGTARATTP